MKIETNLLLCFVCLSLMVSCSVGKLDEPRVLVFSKTAGYHHASIPDGIKAIQEMGEKHHFKVDTTTDADFFNNDTLQKYDAIVFVSTSGNVFNQDQEASFKNFIQSGGGYVGIHGASTTEYDWPWYGKLVGAYFKDHPKPQEAELIIHKDKKFPILDSFPNPWKRFDEWYNFKSLPRNVHVLVSIDEKSYHGGKHGSDHPLVWYHNFDGGRSFYMALGHTTEAYKEPYFLKLLRSGINYAIGKN